MGLRSAGARRLPRWQLSLLASGPAVAEQARSGRSGWSGSPSFLPGASAVLVGTAPGSPGRPAVLLSGGRPGRPVFDLAAGGRSADRLAAVATVDLASCKMLAISAGGSGSWYGFRSFM
jgi:hypothetical protein